MQNKREFNELIQYFAFKSSHTVGRFTAKTGWYSCI